MRRAQPSRVRGSAPAAGHRRLQPAGGRCLCRAPLAASSATFTLPTLPPLPAWAARARRGGGGAASTLKEGDAPALSPRPVAAVRPLSEPSDPALPPVADPPATTALSLAPPPPLPSSPSLALALVAPARAPPAAPPRPPPPSKKGGAPRSAPGRARPESLFTSLWRVSRPVWPTLATALGAQLAAACVFLATPRAFGRVLDAVVVSPTGGASSLAPAFPEALLWLGSLYAGQCVAAFTQSWTLATAADTLGLRLRCAAFEAILRQDAAFFDTSATGELGSRLGADAAAVTGACAAAARGVRASVEAVGALAVLSLTSPLLTLVALSVAPVAAMLSQRLGARVKALSRSAAAAAAEAAATAEEAVANVRTLKSFVREAGACAAYAKRAQRAFRLQQRIALHAGALDGLTRAAGNAGAIAILALGGGLVAAGALTVGALTSFVIYTLYISSALGTLSACYSELKRAEGTGSRLFALLRRVPDVRAPPEALLGPPQPHRRGAMRVSLRGVSFRFPGRPNLALQCVDIELEPGQVTALVGPSGSGKSTVAALLQRFYDPESGALGGGGCAFRDTPQFLTLFPPQAPCCWTAPTSGTWIPRGCGRTWRAWRRSRRCLMRPSRTTLRWAPPPRAAPPRAPRLLRPPWRPTRTSSSPPSHPGTTRGWGSGGWRCRVGSASASPSRAPSSRTRPS